MLQISNYCQKQLQRRWKTMSINDLTKRILSFMNLDLKTYTFMCLVSVEITDRDIYSVSLRKTPLIAVRIPEQPIE